MTDPILPPDERGRTDERTPDAERHERRRARTAADIERRVAGDAALADHDVPAPELDALERITAERRRIEVIPEAEREAGRQRGVAVTRQLINVIFFVAYALLGLRLALGALRADPGAPFARWVVAASEPLHAPFRGIFPNVTIEDGFTFALSVAFAILVYALLHALVQALLRVLAIARRAV
jgi:hypothetical protein